ncbi:MAG: DUF6516 family protein [Candidatus Scalindua sp.]
MDDYIRLVRKELEKKADIINLVQLEWETSLSIKKGILIGKVVFLDDSILRINEFVTDRTKRYRFHYMDSSNNLIRRWDSSPHHKELNTFPYHLHIGDKTLPSPPVTLIDVLRCIEEIVLESFKSNK